MLAASLENHEIAVLALAEGGDFLFYSRFLDPMIFHSCDFAFCPVGSAQIGTLNTPAK